MSLCSKGNPSFAAGKYWGSETYFKIDDCRFIPHPFHFIIHMYLHNGTSCSAICVVKQVALIGPNQELNKFDQILSALMSYGLKLKSARLEARVELQL